MRGRSAVRNPDPTKPPLRTGTTTYEGPDLSASDQRTLYLVNIFTANTADFLNTFSAICEQKLFDVHRRILQLDATLTLLEAKLRSTDGVGQSEGLGTIEVARPPDQLVSQNPSFIRGSFEPPCSF